MVSSLLFNQLSIEHNYNTYQQHNYYKQLIEDSGAIEYAKSVIQSEDELPIIRKLLLTSRLHQKTVPATLITSIASYFPSLQEATNYLATCVETYDLIDYDDYYIYTKIQITSEAQTKINNFGFPLPLTIPPNYITNNNQTGYYSGEGSVLQNHAETNKDINLDCLNQINSIPLTFNDALAKQVPLVKPRKREQLLAHNKFVKHLSHSRVLLTKTIYLTHGYDRRGRLYARGYHYSYQSFDWCKATLSFNETFEP